MAVLYSGGTVEVTSSTYSIEVSSGLVDGIPYTGPYEITPTSETQVLPVTGLTMSQDLTVAPIPSNYGLVTWDGSALTVS